MLKPVLLEKLADTKVDLTGVLGSVAKSEKNLILYVKERPVLWVCIAAGVSVLAQFGLECKGYPRAGRAVGAAGITLTGGLTGGLVGVFLLGPLALPAVTGALVGLLAWTGVDIMRGQVCEVTIIICKDASVV